MGKIKPLKPCPLCGSDDDVIVYDLPTFDCDTVVLRVKCEECDIELIIDGKIKIDRRWSSRTIEIKTEELIVKLRKDIIKKWNRRKNEI